MPARPSASASLVALATLSFLALLAAAPAASADEVHACIGYKPGMCDGNAVLDADVNGEHADVCVILVAGSCDPYDGHLVRAHLNDQEATVPDPCYTTACW